MSQKSTTPCLSGLTIVIFKQDSSLLVFFPLHTFSVKSKPIYVIWVWIINKPEACIPPHPRRLQAAPIFHNWRTVKIKFYRTGHQAEERLQLVSAERHGRHLVWMFGTVRKRPSVDLLQTAVIQPLFFSRPVKCAIKHPARYCASHKCLKMEQDANWLVGSF